MEILIFEYITGGGFNNRALPEALAREGCLMIKELLECCAELKGIGFTVMQDRRVSAAINTPGIKTFTIKPEHDTVAEFIRLCGQCNAVWPIAPEFDGILHMLCQKVEALDKRLLTSPATAVAITGDKLQTFLQLNRHNIATVDTKPFQDAHYEPGEWLVKPVDGVGCMDSYLISSPKDFALLAERLSSAERYIIQPHLQGKKTSLSCLFKEGRAWLLSVNLQEFKIIDSQYHLVGIVVNHDCDFNRYANLLNAIAEVFPDLWGYAGIDLLESPEGIKVLEINPRLTTSFAGIRTARGINTCRSVLDLLTGDPTLNPPSDRQVTIKVEQDRDEN